MRVIALRLVQLVIVLWLVATVMFFLVRAIPGGPVDAILQVRSDTPQGKVLREQVTHDLGLDKSLSTQYVNYLGDLATGNLGKQYGSNIPVSTTLQQALPESLQLMLYAQVLALAVAIPLGVITAYRAGSKVDRGVNATAFGLLSLPGFVLALLLSFFVGVQLRWLPTSGYAPGWLDPLFESSRTPDIGKHIESMILPTVTLAVGQIAIYMRLLRSDMIATLQENFITMARSKGLSDRRILWRHALRPSSLTLLTVAGLNVGALIGGAVVVEVIFGLPGIGKQIQIAFQQRQYVELQSLIVVVAVFFVAINVAVDVLYRIVDPRIRRAATAA